jgi:malate dehydrogenase
MSRKGKVTVVGAGFYGSTTAQRLAEYDIFTEVVLTDIIEGKPEGLALDMNQSRPVEGFETKVTGQTTGQAGEGYEVIGGSDIVVVTAGLARKPGMSRMDLIEVNAKIVRNVVENVAKYAPDAVLIVSLRTGSWARRACWTPPGSAISWPRSWACRWVRYGR